MPPSPLRRQRFGLIWDEITIWGPSTVPEHSSFDEEMVIHEPSPEQLLEIEKVWVHTPSGRRLEAVAAKCAELGVEIVSMRRQR